MLTVRGPATCAAGLDSAFTTFGFGFLVLLGSFLAIDAHRQSVTVAPD
jgi:hypothetical protein